MQQYVVATSTWSEKNLSFEVEYVLQNAKCMLFNMVLFDLDSTTVFLKWQFRMKIHYS